MVDPYGWHTIERDKLKDIHNKLVELESLDWNEILIARKYWNHTIRKDQICKDAQDRLEQISQDDIDELVSLRLQSRERVWGFVINRRYVYYGGTLTI